MSSYEVILSSNLMSYDPGHGRAQNHADLFFGLIVNLQDTVFNGHGGRGHRKMGEPVHSFNLFGLNKLCRIKIFNNPGDLCPIVRSIYAGYALYTGTTLSEVLPILLFLGADRSNQSHPRYDNPLLVSFHYILRALFVPLISGLLQLPMQQSPPSWPPHPGFPG